jgi:hypothetical protein
MSEALRRAFECPGSVQQDGDCFLLYLEPRPLTPAEAFAELAAPVNGGLAIKGELGMFHGVKIVDG